MMARVGRGGVEQGWVEQGWVGSKAGDKSDTETAFDAGWWCGTCSQKCPKYHLVKCPNNGCKGTRPAADKKNEKVEEKTLLSKEVEKDILKKNEPTTEAGEDSDKPADTSGTAAAVESQDQAKLKKLQTALEALEEDEDDEVRKHLKRR